MKALPAMILGLLSAAMPLHGAIAADAGAQRQDSAAQSAPTHDVVNPYTPVFIVTSRKSYQNLHALVRNPATHRDSLGNELVVAETTEGQLPELSEIIHENEKRCGGYFAFASRQQAETFIANDRSAIAVNASLITYTIDNAATVSPWLPQAAEANIYNTINTLQSYKNRYYTSSYGKSAAEWIKSRWETLAAGRSDVNVALYTGCTNCGGQPSVILTVQGNELPGEVVVLGAHLDSITGSSNEQVAPGADDDASGVATLTETLRVALASGWKPQRTVKFMAYAAEEAGLRGSAAIAQEFKNNGVNVVGVLQLDMTEYKVGTPEDMQIVTDYSSGPLKIFFTNLFDTYLAPMGLTRGTITCGYGCSDHASWSSAGFPAAMMFEAGNMAGANTPAFTGYNPNIHTTGDTLAFLGESAAHSVKFAQFALAFLGELGKTTTPAGDTTPPTISAAANKTANAAGWFHTNVKVSWTCNDTGGSGLVSCPAVQNFTAETTAAGVTTAAHVVSDNAGNHSAPSNQITVKLDKTKPTITAAPTTAPNAFGWYTGNVAIHYTCSDALSGIASCPADTVAKKRGANVPAPNGKAVDVAGNKATSNGPALNIDINAPKISGVTYSGPLVVGNVVTASAVADDAQSGIASSECGPVDTSSAQKRQLTCTATNGAGMVTSKTFSYKVVAP